MSILSKFGFGKRPLTEASAESAAHTEPQTETHTETLPTGALLERADPPVAEAPPRETPATVRVRDEFGRELQIPIETWRTSMLPEALQKAFNEPDRLYGLIVDALGLKLAADVLPAAAHLYATDTNAERGAVIYSIVLMDVQQPQVAEKILSTYLASHGPSGVVLTNLAKALTDQHRDAEADDTLWRGLEADPNQENGLGWYAIRQKERHGEAAWGEAMRRVAALPGAWRPQVWLARLALEGGNTAQAMTLYAEALDRAGKPAPIVLLQQMSGDLGMRGLIAEAVALTLPAYDAKFHGLAVGNNLIKAQLDLGHREEARALVDELYLQQRKDWADNLNYWENAIKAQELAAKPELKEINVTAYRFDGPVWLPANSAACGLFPPVGARGTRMVFLGSSVTSLADRKPGAQMPDAAGRTSRFMPLFLAESVYVALGIDVATIVPWVEGGGFAMMGTPWSDEDAAKHARATESTMAAVLHLTEGADGATGALRGLTVPREEAAAIAVVLETSIDVRWIEVGRAATTLAAAVVKSVAERVPATGGTLPAYVLPDAENMGNYLLRLEQLLAVRAAGTETAPENFLTGEREMARGLLDLAVRAPQSVPVRLVLLETLRRLHAMRPELAMEFREGAGLLQKRYPLSDTAAQAVVSAELEAIWR